MKDYDSKEYAIDFPDDIDWNWGTVVIKTPHEPYYDGCKITGVLLHDGCFLVNGVLFEQNEFEKLF